MDKAISEQRGETTRLGSFEILRKLTRGGMAEIFLARTCGPSGFEKLVVLKKILAKYADKPRYIQLFLEEAKLAASLDHPSIAQVYDIGTVDGAYFFTMEHLHGQDVRSILHRAWRIGERFPIEHAVQIARHVASALHFAHEKRGEGGALLGIVHRDVSPSNIIATYDGATKLLDFGVAKTAASTVKTRTGALKGKIAYMSPEQARGAPLDRRSDIFSLGIVLWEMVTTQRLYRGENDLATLQLIIHQPPRPPSAVRPECPPELERIVLRALAQDPEARYPTAEQLMIELDELAREHKLKQSPSALAQTLGQLFGPELGAWHEAQAAGVSLAVHLHEVGDMTTPVSESDFVEPGAGLDSEPDDDGDLDDDDDDELTEHAAPIIEPLSPLASEPIDPTGEDPRPAGRAVGGTTPRDTASPIDPTGEDPRPAGRAVGVPTPRDTASPILPEPGTVAGRRTTPGGPVPVAVRATPSRPQPVAPSVVIEPSATVVDGAPLADAPDEHASSRSFAAPAPGAPLAASALHAPSSPLSTAPWQSGQPPSPSERVARSWAVIDLPAFDPEVFERQRRIVLRVAAGVIGLVILLAILAGRC